MKRIALGVMIATLVGCGSDPELNSENNQNSIGASPQIRDMDNDGISDDQDADIDGDGYANAQDMFPLNYLESADLDLDGIGDNSDSDIDGDGFENNEDAFPLDKMEWTDLDGDKIGDNSDSDIDGDNVVNENDAFPENKNEWSDIDLDGIGDNSDIDKDGDGVNNQEDAYPNDPTQFEINKEQDTDNDGIKDINDSDIDNDGFLNEQDAFIFDPTEWSDLDGDDVGDNSDNDIDGDFVLNDNDVFPLDFNESKDTDMDGIGNNTDSDDDNDGFSDDEEKAKGTDPLNALDFPDDNQPVDSCEMAVGVGQLIYESGSGFGSCQGCHGTINEDGTSTGNFELALKDSHFFGTKGHTGVLNEYIFDNMAKNIENCDEECSDNLAAFMSVQINQPWCPIIKGEGEIDPNSLPEPDYILLPARIESENFYKSFDTTQENQGGCGQEQPVDLQISADEIGLCDIGWTAPGEWLTYHINVEQEGIYQLFASIASAGSQRTMQVIVLGDESFEFEIATGPANGWKEFSEVDLGLQKLPAGQYQVDVKMITGGLNFNYLRFDLVEIIDIDKEITDVVFEKVGKFEVPETSCNLLAVSVETQVTPKQLKNIINDVSAPLEINNIDDLINAIPNNTKNSVLDQLSLDTYFNLFDVVANQTANNFDQLHLDCNESSVQKRDCANAWLEKNAKQAWGRTLQDGERELMLAELFDVETNFYKGMKQIVLATYLSANTLYQWQEVTLVGTSELLNGRTKAKKLAWLLWNSVPDIELIDAAESGQLATESGLKLQVQRMLNDEKAKRGFGAFHQQWLHLIGDPSEQSEAGKIELDLIAGLLLENQGSFSDIFTTNQGFVNDVLADVYGVSKVHASNVYEQVTLNDRRGVLTRAALLAGTSFGSSSPTRRGEAISASILCVAIPEPPVEVQDMFAVLPELNGRSFRTMMEETTAAPSCQGCHANMDPFGFALENYDGIGHFRLEQENGAMINSSVNTSPLGVPFNDASDLSNAIAQSQDAMACYADHWFEYAFLRHSQLDGCVSQDLKQRFINSNGDLIQLIYDIIENPAFHYRKF
ncbi:DUF1588 domain-containing protein [Marinicellulosiphila megalodicopiae]|uniref:DUF1588 domain-containing protein n=1 Tax=Marinicellulosiphila megalodicopiae TaxID=2724896 RepID=UPI003BAF4AD4